MRLHSLVSRVLTRCGVVLGGFLMPFLVLIAWPAHPAVAHAAPLLGTCQNSLTGMQVNTCPDCTITDFDMDTQPDADCTPCAYTWNIGIDCGGEDRGASGAGTVECGSRSTVKVYCPDEETVAMQFRVHCSACQ